LGGGDPYEFDAIQKIVIDQIARDHGMTIAQTVVYVVSLASYVDRRWSSGDEVRAVAGNEHAVLDVRELIDTIKAMG
jgi:hypothetical protein